ncbi:MAG: phospholipid carrier-dependent glycosyltransferase [Hyellaceae cyanobacterium CSU_1_1]|nr:phospholipid carrier-dependent glycosyltransferase [Hyellaceae cyanobacterium CSU_1_1]
MPIKYVSMWRRSSNRLRQSEVWLEFLCLSGLLLAASALFLVNLSSLPLLDFHEATLAQVAKEIYRSTDLSTWIFPTLGNKPYLEGPTLVHNLVAIAYKIAGVGELTTRFPGALLGAVSVLLLYQIGREIFVARLPALFSALVYLTCLPVVRYSRLATLDGPLLCFELLTIWAVLRSRRDLKWTLVTGIGLSLMSLTKGLFGIQILAIILLFLFWDTPRLLSSIYFWAGLFLGAVPSAVWYFAQLWYYRQLNVGDVLVNLLLPSTQQHFVMGEFSPSYYLIQGIQYLLPWLIVMFAGVQLIQHNLHWGWGKLLAVWLGGYLILEFLMLNHNDWFVLPLYPALALAAGKQLDRIYNLPSFIIYPRSWIYSFALMALLAALAGLNWGVRNYIDFYLPFICGSVSITLGATAIAIAQQDKQFISLLFWGLFVSIFVLVISPHWIWELGEQKSVKPMTEFVQQYTPPQPVANPMLSFFI